MTEQKGDILNINKPLKWTSFDVVKKIRRTLGIKKIGHAGTLDPLATGVLLLCTHKKTKEIESLQAMQKTYTGKLILGKTTPSYDLETPVTESGDISQLKEEDIRGSTAFFLGTIAQAPPIYSAVKINGERAYHLARAGKIDALAPKQVTIYSFFITDIRLPEVDFEVTCGKGTYIRSLVRDFGERLGVGAYLSELCRTRIGPYTIEKAQSMSLFE